MKQTRPRFLGPRPIPALAAARALSGALFAGGCETETSEDDAVEDLTIVVEQDKSRIAEEEAGLAEREAAMEAERERLEQERKALTKKLTTLSQSDKSGQANLLAEKEALDKEEQRIRDQARSFEEKRDRLEAEKSALIERISAMTENAGAGAGAGAAVQIAERERRVARREADVAAREKAVAEREKEAAKTLQDLNTVLASLKDGAGVTRTVVVNAPASGSSGATRGQAQKSQKNLRNKMDAKGLLMEDLSSSAASAYQQGVSAMNSKDWGTASAAFDQVAAAVDATAINRQFIQGKLTRLNRAMASKKLDAGRKKKVQDLLGQINDAYTDGRFDRANRRANQLAALLRGK